MDITETVRSALGNAGSTCFSIGNSVLGEQILAAHVGNFDGRQVVITAGIHARECYSALVVLAQLERIRAQALCGGIYFIPLVNPDGAKFFESGLYGESDTEAAEKFAASRVLSAHLTERLVWKANADGVDLNTNFDANFGTGKCNKRSVGASDYVGLSPFCAPESAALARFTREIGAAATVSYHAMGGELYWEFFQRGAARRRDERLAARISRHIGVKKVDGDLGSAGGYKDWCIMRLGIPAFTVELVSEKNISHPLYPDAYKQDIQKNLDLPEYLLEILSETS